MVYTWWTYIVVINFPNDSLWIITVIINLTNDNSYPNGWRSDGWDADDQTKQRAEHGHASARHAALLQGQQTRSPPAGRPGAQCVGKRRLLTIAHRKACQQSVLWAKLRRMISSRARPSTAASSRGRTCRLDSSTFLWKDWANGTEIWFRLCIESRTNAMTPSDLPVRFQRA